MKIEVLSCLDNIKTYLAQGSKDGCEEAWDRLVVAPHWEKLCCYSPIDLSGRKPGCVRDLAVLKEQADLLGQLDEKKLAADFTAIANRLPNYDDDPIFVMLVPLGNENAAVNERQNGVIGTALFGNILIQVNPLIPGWQDWVLYVFAHEYCHTVWGSYWYNLHDGETKNDLLQALIIDGEADSFALRICPSLKPSWLYLDRDDQIERLYREKYADLLRSTDFDYGSFLFGNDEMGIPWCGGYAVGYHIVQKYISRNRISFSRLMEMPPEELIT